jgi:hypothetical protein
LVISIFLAAIVGALATALAGKETETNKKRGPQTMKPLHSLGVRRATSILVTRIAFPLLCLSAGQMLVQPCAGAPFAFENTGSLAAARDRHAGTLLPDGTVLIAGGGNNCCAVTTVELYDPATGVCLKEQPSFTGAR